MEINKLRSIIKEAVKEIHLKEIEAVAENAAMEARLAEYDKAIKTCENQIATAENLEEIKEFIDENKINEVRKRLKNLKKEKEKIEKAKAKKNNGKKVVTDEPMEESYVEEMDNAINPKMGYAMEEVDLSDKEKEKLRKNAETNDKEYNIMNESFLKMQKLAGVITESQYNQKIQMLNEAFTMPVYNPETKQMEEKSVNIIDFKVDKEGKMNDGTYPVYIGVDAPAANRSNADFAKGKKAFGTYVNDKGESTGKFWDLSDPNNKELTSGIKNWDALKVYAKQEFLKQNQTEGQYKDQLNEGYKFNDASEEIASEIETQIKPAIESTLKKAMMDVATKNPELKGAPNYGLAIGLIAYQIVMDSMKD
jgi:hypothetical protein